MGTMEINPLLLKLSIPMMISMLVQALYNVVDSVFVSHVSESALTAVSLAFSLQNVMIAVGVGTGVGVNALLSKSLGEKNQSRANATAENGIFLSLCSFVVFFVIGLTCMKPYFYAQTSDPVIAQQGIRYLSVCCIFSLGIFTQTMGEKLLAATGRTHLSMISQLVGAVVNIILDPIFIFGLHMGVRGAALATVLSQAVSCVWVLRFLTGPRTALRLKRQYLRPQARLILPCVALGLAAFIMQSSESVISMCFNSSLLKYGGDPAVGAMTILSSVMQFAMLPLQGIAQGAQPITSYNYGARNSQRVRASFRLLLTVSLIYSVLLWAAIMLFPQLFARMFTPNPELIAFTARALRLYCAALFLFGLQIACQMTFVSIGNAPCSIFVAVLRKFILLLPLIYLLPHLLPDQTSAVYLAEPTADVIAMSCTTVLFSRQFKKVLKKLDEPLP